MDAAGGGAACVWVWIRHKSIARFIEGGSVGIRVNSDILQYFQKLQGLRRGDPLSPLFILGADMLAILITRAKEYGQVRGLIPHLVDGGVSILHYSDYTILFLENYFEKVVNMKLNLTFLNNYRI